MKFLLADTLRKSSRRIDEVKGHPCSWCHICHLSAQSLNKIHRERKKQTNWLHKLSKVPKQFGVRHVGTVILTYIYCTFLSPLSSAYLSNVCRKRWSICIWVWHSHDSWMTSEVYGTVWGRTFLTVKSDMLARLTQLIKQDFMIHPNATSSLVLKSVMQILTGWPPNLQPLIHFVNCARMLNSTWSGFEACVRSFCLSFCPPFFLSFCLSFFLCLV